MCATFFVVVGGTSGFLCADWSLGYFELCPADWLGELNAAASVRVLKLACGLGLPWTGFEGTYMMSGRCFLESCTAAAEFMGALTGEGRDSPRNTGLHVRWQRTVYWPMDSGVQA